MSEELYNSIATFFVCAGITPPIVWWLENARRTLIWFIKDQCEFGSTTNIDRDFRRNNGFFRNFVPASETEYGLFAVTLFACIYVFVGAFLGMVWPIYVVLGIVIMFVGGAQLARHLYREKQKKSIDKPEVVDEIVDKVIERLDERMRS